MLLPGGVGTAIYLLPLPETKKGLAVALSGRKREPVGVIWSYACGAMGLWGGFFGTSSYMSRIGKCAWKD